MHPFENAGHFEVVDEFRVYPNFKFEAPEPMGVVSFAIQFARFPLSSPFRFEGKDLDAVVAVSLVLRPREDPGDLRYCVASAPSLSEIKAKFLQHSHDDCEIPLAPPSGVIGVVPDLDAQGTEIAFALCEAGWKDGDKFAIYKQDFGWLVPALLKGGFSVESFLTALSEVDNEAFVAAAELQSESEMRQARFLRASLL